mmetsp:Transcript_15204/g.29522  ORF Transcript_15204/g.29522 Transcript_15204/m.29522 type:complete len:83 (+) Transcript_15204:4359-4607(+)
MGTRGDKNRVVIPAAATTFADTTGPEPCRPSPPDKDDDECCPLPPTEVCSAAPGVSCPFLLVEELLDDDDDDDDDEFVLERS